MLKVQLDSVEGVPVIVTADRPILARLVREVEAAFDTRLEQAHGHVRGGPGSVRRQCLRRDHDGERASPRGITGLDLAEYQVRHGRSYADALPDRIALTSLGYWHWSAGAEHYVAPSVDGKSLASTQDIWRVRRRGPKPTVCPSNDLARRSPLTTTAGRAALDLQVSPSA